VAATRLHGSNANAQALNRLFNERSEVVKVSRQ
jgi:hypothetical protein